MAMMLENCHSSLKNHGAMNKRQIGDKSKIPVMLHQHPSTTLRKHSLIRTEYQGDGVTAPQFSIRSVNKVLSGGKRTDRRKLSDDFVIRRQDSERQNNLLSSFSMEYINSSNVLCCVRDSNELLQAKLASSSSRLVEKINDQAEVLYNDIQHPKAFKHPTNNISQIKVKPSKKKNSYTEMYLAKQQQLDKQLDRKKCANISKQRSENELKLRQFISPEIRNYHGEEGTESKVSTYPHTLPSAMCAISGGGEFSALYGGYSALPPIEGAYSALPPIETKQEPAVEKEVLPPPSPKKAGDGYSAPKPQVTYRPYTLKEYGAMKRSFGYRSGGLGPDTLNTAYKSKMEKSKRISLYAQQLRSVHRTKEFPKRKSVNPRYQPPSKSEIAHQYASKIPRPLPAKRKPKLSPLPDMIEKEPSILRDDILQERVRRHIQHKRILEDLDNV